MPELLQVDTIVITAFVHTNEQHQLLRNPTGDEKAMKIMSNLHRI